MPTIPLEVELACWPELDPETQPFSSAAACGSITVVLEGGREMGMFWDNDTSSILSSLSSASSSLLSLRLSRIFFPTSEFPLVLGCWSWIVRSNADLSCKNSWSVAVPLSLLEKSAAACGGHIVVGDVNKGVVNCSGMCVNAEWRRWPWLEISRSRVASSDRWDEQLSRLFHLSVLLLLLL